ncbi:hypothetical protein ACHAWC_006710 [Mediolabrus comicus]
MKLLFAQLVTIISAFQQPITPRITRYSSHPSIRISKVQPTSTNSLALRLSSENNDDSTELAESSHSSYGDQHDRNNTDSTPSEASKRQMLKFVLPALGIYLMNPLLSNIDNSFVGRTVGKAGLAALSPATLCIDQALYLFSFLSRATTGLASRAYANASNTSGSDGTTGNVGAARDAASPALTVSLICGVALTLLYTFRTSSLLEILNVDPVLRASASSYIHWRGVSAWAAMAQSVLLSLFMVTRDVITPLKIISCAAVLNIFGDALFCVWPIRGGCGGAAAATACATLISSFWMVKTLRKKKLLPALRIPKKNELAALGEFMGPLLAITLTRMSGFMNMQRRAMTLGVTALAGYQLCMNLLIFFVLFGEPLSQLGQTKLPGLIENENSREAMATLRSILMLSVFSAVGVGLTAYCTSTFGPALFSSDLGVQAVAKGAAPQLFLAVSMCIMGIAIDGAMMASRDFGFMLITGIVSFFVQAKLLHNCNTVSGILATFAVRLGSYTILSVVRAFATTLGIRKYANQTC